MSTATTGRTREYRVRDEMIAEGSQPLPIARGNAPLCACGCGNRTSTVRTEYILGHRPRRNPSDRFWEAVKIAGPTECWLWARHLYANGYAMFRKEWDGPNVMAHRFAWEDSTGQPVPEDMTIDHLCRNRSCMNPTHMEVVTRGENTRRAAGWVQAHAARRIQADEACPAGHPRTPEHASRRPTGQWRCRTCRNIQLRAKRSASKEAS